jgi:cellulose biosynthesis protein BcsQ
LFCLIAAEASIAVTIKNNLQKMNSFSEWKFEACSDAVKLGDWSDKNIDVLVLSRYLPGSDPVRLFPRVKILFPSAHIVLLVGQVTESCRAYIRAAAGAGLHNTVTGKLPGDRPYTLMVALTRSKKPELDGYADLGDVGAEGNVEESRKNVLEDRDDLDEELEDIPVAVRERPEILQTYTTKKTIGVLVVSTANKGGVGKTTTAIATATALSRAGIPTALVDLDLGAPDLATFFKIQDVPGIERLANLNNVSPVHIDRLLVNVEKNLHVLPGPMSKTLPRFEGGELLMVLDYLKGRFSVVVCDTSPEPWTKRWLYSTFEAVDMALAVVDQSKFSEEETKKYAPTLLMMGVKPEKIRIVVNRFSPKLHTTRVIETMFNAGFKKSCSADMLPRVGAVIQNNWDASVRGTYNGEIADLDGAGSQWHKLAKEIAALAGYRYEPTDSGNGHDRGKASLFDKLFRKGGH